MPGPPDHDFVKLMVDGVSFTVLCGVIAEVLPSIATLMTVIWMAIRIWESETCKALTGRKD